MIVAQQLETSPTCTTPTYMMGTQQPYQQAWNTGADIKTNADLMRPVTLVYV